MLRVSALGFLALTVACSGDSGTTVDDTDAEPTASSDSSGAAPTGGASEQTTASTTPTSTTAEPTSTTAGTANTDATDGTAGTDTGEPVDPNLPPVAMFTSTVASGDAPKTVTLDASASTDADGQIVSYAWTYDGGVAEGPQVTLPLGTGCYAVELTVTDDDGATGKSQSTVVVTAGDPVMPPVVTIDKAPIERAVLPRDLVSNEGTASFHGVVESDGYAELRAELMVGEEVRATQTTPLCGAAPLEFNLDVPVPAELTSFTVRLSLVAGDQAIEVGHVDDLVAGDIYLVTGQSNAAASPQQGTVSNDNKGPFVRSFGTRTDVGDVSDSDRVWHDGDGDMGGAGALGQWALRMGAQLVATHNVPVGILNGARGGKAIEFFQRNDNDPADLTTNYGRLLTRTRNAGIDGSARAILWYQGESDGGQFQKHLDGFIALKADWAEDFPSVERIYVTQIRAGAGTCAPDGIRTQEVQRTLADTYPEITLMASNGLDGHDGCHFLFENGYRELGDHYAALLGRDLYGATPEFDVQPPNPASARFADGGKQIIVTMKNADSVIVCEPGAFADFRIHAGGTSTVTGCVANGHELTLNVKGDASMATGINYLGHKGAGPWVKNENGLGMLSFWRVPIAAE